VSTFDLDDISDEDDIEVALELISEIEQLVEDLPERAEDFGMSVQETANDIAVHIEETSHVTKKQITALENMLDGLQRWFHD